MIFVSIPMSKNEMAQRFCDRIEQDFLENKFLTTSSLGGFAVFMDRLEMGNDPIRQVGLLRDFRTKREARKFVRH